MWRKQHKKHYSSSSHITLNKLKYDNYYCYYYAKNEYMHTRYWFPGIKDFTKRYSFNYLSIYL